MHSWLVGYILTVEPFFLTWKRQKALEIGREACGVWDQDHACHDIMYVVCVCARTNDIVGSPKVYS